MRDTKKHGVGKQIRVCKLAYGMGPKSLHAARRGFHEFIVSWHIIFLVGVFTKVPDGMSILDFGYDIVAAGSVLVATLADVSFNFEAYIIVHDRTWWYILL